MFNYDKFSQNLRKVRNNLNYTQEQFAEKLQIDSKFLGKIELGYKKPSTTTLINILNFLNISFKDFNEDNTNTNELKINLIIDNINCSELDNNDKELLLNIIIAINKKGNQ